MLTPGIHLFHKPVGPTSFSIVQTCLEQARSEKPQHAPKLCHGGTLDPFASGLLLILVEPATKLFDHLHSVPKIYEAVVRWGVETDNGDPLGNIVSQGDASLLTPVILDRALAGQLGWHDQIPPATSNKRVAGERAYLRAHRGEVVDLPPSRVYLHEARWLEHQLPRWSRLRMSVRGGYYVRSLARDLGRALGCGAHLERLHRAAIGPWTDPGPGQTAALRGRDVLPWASVRTLNDNEVGELRQSRRIAIGKIDPPDWPVPTGYPDPQSPVRGMHRDRLTFLLTPDGNKLASTASLFRGI